MSDIFGGGQPAGQVVNTQQQTNPFTPYIQQGAAGAQTAYNNFQVSPFTQQAIQGAGQRATTGSPLNAAAGQSLMTMLNPAYRNPQSNPTFSSSVNDALGQAKSQYLGLYGGPAGENAGNSGFQEALTRNLGNVATNAYTNQYNILGNQALQASAQAPTIANQDYVDLNAMAGAGQAQQNLPFAGVNQYAHSLSSLPGGGGNSSNSSPYFTNPAANAMGLGMGAMSLYNMGSQSGLWGAGGGAADGAGWLGSLGGAGGFSGGAGFGGAAAGAAELGGGIAGTGLGLGEMLPWLALL